jgi:hypothetical protein
MASDEKPAHILEIPDSLGRDVDRYREGKTDNAPPIEAFMSEGSLQKAWDASRAAPVHQEDLVPITKAESVRRTTFDGEHLPRAPATRRVIPAPFRRESISIDHHGRRWTTPRADEVAVGDVVVDLGKVASTETVMEYATVAGVPDVAVGMKILLTGIAGNQAEFEPGTRVRAFCLAELWRSGAACAAPGSPISAAERASRRTATTASST